LLADWDEVEIANDLQGIPRVAAARNTWDRMPSRVREARR